MCAHITLCVPVVDVLVYEHIVTMSFFFFVSVLGYLLFTSNLVLYDFRLLFKFCNDHYSLLYVHFITS